MYKGGGGGVAPEPDENLKKIKQNGGFPFNYFFAFWQGSLIPQSYEPAPLYQLPVLPSVLKINSHSPQIPKTPGSHPMSASFACEIQKEDCNYSKTKSSVAFVRSNVYRTAEQMSYLLHLMYYVL